MAVAAVLGAFGPPPEVVVSGLNLASTPATRSGTRGTVGAVLTGQNSVLRAPIIARLTPA
jgi:broad specificity polyphosphatase/5'/3'-nucleotidase SurE